MQFPFYTNVTTLLFTKGTKNQSQLQGKMPELTLFLQKPDQSSFRCKLKRNDIVKNSQPVERGVLFQYYMGQDVVNCVRQSCLPPAAKCFSDNAKNKNIK